ncbi:hypothetical protein BCR34DRAFT_608172 [Clohesyomyces aquaticus]|uniref:Cyanovirin-N domain-containing protein n=1 Tax=Clohesyomyces aquaticus TaxID=1231657 RepID=A0A1Y1YAW0_9PLEO|nr:hypothetical protein BCR34DRAFT_608172 [Clohesyomyces aquaticus]
MQLFRLTLLAAVTIPQVCACIRVHARQSYLPWPDTDHISVEIWNDHGVYLNCGDCNWKSYAGQDCKRSCGHFDITIYNEFQTVKVYQKKNKKTYVLKTKKPKSQVYCCLEANETELRGRIRRLGK